MEDARGDSEGRARGHAARGARAVRRGPALVAVGVLFIAVLVVIAVGAVTPPNIGWLVLGAAVIAGALLAVEWWVFSVIERR